MSEINLRMERLALLIGQMIGQIAELLNNIQKKDIKPQEVYLSLYDINKMAAIQVHELYYKHNSETKNS